MTPPAVERGRAVRRRLLAAAVELIPERGWTAVSTRVLAERAGVTPSVVHYHFPSLPALLNEAVIGLIGEVLSELEMVLEAAPTPAEAVRAMLASTEGFTGDDPMTRVATEAYLAAGRDDELRRRIGEQVGGFRRRLGRRLAEHGVPLPEETATVLVAAIDGLLLHRGLDVETDAAATTAVLCRLIDRRDEDT